MVKQEKKESKKEKLVLLDAHAIIHRAYHALPDFSTSRGQPTGALYGLVLMILKIVQELKPDYIIACYDLPKPTYRHEVYEGYKGTRAKIDDNLIDQLEKSKRICEALNIPIYSKEGFEADDILGTIVEEIQRGKNKQNVDIVIASGDMDTMQLVEDEGKNKPGVKVYTLKKGIKDTILYDERAVEEKFGFAPELLPDYKGLRGDASDNIIGIAGIGDKTATELIQKFGSIENIYKNLKSPPARAGKKSLIRTELKPRVIELLENGEEEARFSKMLATIRRDAPIDFMLPQKWKDAVNIEKCEEMFKEFEFRSLGERLRSALKIEPLFGKSELQNIPPNELEETKVALWVTDSNITNPKIEDILNFANTDSFTKAREVIFSELKKRDSEKVFYDIEKPLIPILEKMSKHGVLIDKTEMTKLNKKYSDELEGITQKIWKLVGTEFNIASPKQLSEVLFVKLGLSTKNQKKTSTGAMSTKESELLKMKDLHPIIPLILEHREIAKLLGTYIGPIPKLLGKDGRLHAQFIQTGSTTGRMASENPNMQNIPIGSERGRAIRGAFLAQKGFVLGAFDYSQIELRIAAILSGDKKLIEIFKSGEDVHASVAAEVFSVPKEKVTKEMRRQAKVINFGILYGMGVTALMQNLGSDRKTAQEFYNAYFEKFSGIAKYLDKTKEEAERQGFTKTLFGRRRYFEGIKSKLPFIRAAAERMAINAPIQGTQADIIKIAMKRIDDFLVKEKLDEDAHLIMQIHDELIYEIRKEKLDKVSNEIISIMQNVIPSDVTIGVPILTNFNYGQNWGEMNE